MKIQFKNIGFFLLVSTISAISFVSCKNDTWEEHYSIKSETINSNTNLWKTISTNPELKKFTWALKKTGYDVILSTNQMFTVWAPKDSDPNSIDTTKTIIDIETFKKQYVENHISKYGYSASGNLNQKINLINKKVSQFDLANNKFMFGTSELVEKNIFTSNGLLHIVNTRLNFFANVWESLNTDTRLDSIRKYLYSFDELFFDAENSIPGDVNEEGKTVYLDSVIINTNKMFRILGKMNVEDSSYTAIWPTNQAWIEAYDKIKSYYRYISTNPITADTLQKNNTKLALVSDLVYSNTIQKSPSDSLVMSSKNVYHNPAYLYNGAELFNASNGKYYITNSLKFEHYKSWNKEIRVEAEKTKGRESSYSSIYDRTYLGTAIPGISGRKYIEVNASTTSINPTVTFEVPNTLSGKLNPDKTIAAGAAYNVYCVFVPDIIRTTETKARANKVYFTIDYLGENGKVTKYTFDNSGQYFVTNKLALTKVLVASNVTFPYSEFGLTTPNVKFKVLSKVLSTETAKYTRDLIIDCIILEPVH